MKAQERSVTCIAPVNIALVKYWGKRDEDLILPVNSSLSVTLDTAALRTMTTASVVEDTSKVTMSLNGQEIDLQSNRRICAVVDRLRAMAGKQEVGLRITSENNFPTAAGLASSAAGLSCLAYTIANVLGAKESYPGELSAVARQGSGSACRSLYGGFVKWNMGTADDGSDSIAEQVVDEKFWDDIRILICVVDDRKKSTSSTTGMNTSVRTSQLLQYRAETIVPRRMKDMEDAIRSRDFSTVAELTMKDSNQFHAVCLDTYPPISYLNETSKSVIAAIHEFNAASNEIRAAYTFDAGPNAVLLCRAAHFQELQDVVVLCFPPSTDTSTWDDRNGAILGRGSYAPQSNSAVSSRVMDRVGNHEGEISYYIRTQIGSGPQILYRSAH
mmetsp:Transcript_2635/g.7917  ORF Transcript_2635/g.7917 Transcript_2635/m.7917 type:complete len:386 (+) Transcript_2635:37-1194(+)